VADAVPRQREDLERIEGLRRWRVTEFGQDLVAQLARH
jgi:hypothetical protein